MTNEERIQANADKGYILVASFDGYEIHKKLNEVGGWTYYSDAIGTEGAYVIWNTSITSEEELEAILADIQKPTKEIPEPVKTLLEINGLATKMQALVNKYLENNSGGGR